METALERAKEALGGPAGLAKALGNITSQAISQWRQVPHDRVIDVERVTGISRHELRPDLSKIFVNTAPERVDA
ncbi:helix-turn-helix domain-containing protein [Devosia sp. WQ 349]|uniref:transcriptional regulator n=1 Tax=Devosia sp. WQ 349K1 TaxID=2800329 RepID=UPI001905E53F|nr:Cro/CI family transcriptional regulator [Devosia sp. WQ 349K1]MBK1793391.1 helix-turn-helix domain-containing protein [Devosia sp. WQ 349K1]